MWRGPALTSLKLRRGVLLTTVGLLWPTVGAYAQSVAGPGDDAITVPRGAFRYSLSGIWHDYDQVFSPSSSSSSSAQSSSSGALRKGPLFGALTMDAAGTALLPQLTETQNQLRALTGQSNYLMSLGRLDAAGEVRQSITLLSVEYGVTRRVSVGVRAPYAESRDVTQLMLNRVGTGANIGLNPALQSATSAAATAQNSALTNQLESSRALLANEIARCSDQHATDCDAIRANPQAAAALVSRTQEAAASIANVYGTNSKRGSMFIPLAGSSAQSSIEAMIATLKSDYTKYGITAIADGSAPKAASQILGPGGMEKIGTDSAFGVGYKALGNTRRAGIGDIDLTATFLILDSFGENQLERLNSDKRGVRLIASGGWRFGMAGADRTEDAFDVPIGEGANAFLLRSTADFMFSKRLWLSTSARITKPLQDQVTVVLPFRTLASTFAFPVAVGQASRSLGVRSDIEITPRMSIGDFFGITTAYTMRRWGEDSYRVAQPPSSSDVSVSRVTPSRTLHLAGFGVTFSTLASYARGRSRIAAEVMYSHSIPLAASGTGTEVPAVLTDRLELRVYTGFPRR